MLKVLLAIGLIGFSVNMAWQKYSATTVSEGFVQIPAPDRLEADQILIMAPQNCTREVAQKADALEKALKEHQLEAVRSQQVSFSFQQDTPTEDIQRLKKLMKQQGPIVFVNGKGMSAPELEDILTQL